MDPAFFYTYVNTLVFYDGVSKYNAIIAFMNDNTIIDEYKRIPEVAIETEHAIQLIYGVVNNQVNNQQIHAQNNNKRVHNNNEDEYFDNPPPPPRLRRS
jgi:hypothetical protein